jgi:hypothetical protein
MDFFRYHGPWAPGVRLFRRRLFATKALAISAMFLVPVATLGGCYLADKADAIGLAATQRLGVQLAQAVLPVLQAAQDHRLQAVLSAGAGAATQGWAPTQAALQAAMARLAAVQSALGAGLGTANHHAALKAAVAQAASPAGAWQPGPPDAAMAGHSAVVDAALALIGEAADGSGLTQDADTGSRHLMDAALLQRPPMQEMAARLALIGAMAPPAGSAGPISQRAAVEAATLHAHHTETLQADLDKALAASPALVAMLRPDDLLDTTRAAPAMLQALDQVLAARLAGLERQRAITVAAVVVPLAMAGYLFYALCLVTRGGLREVRRHLEAMAAGDLTGQPQPWGSDEAANLMVSVAGMQGSMRRIVAEVRTASSGLVHASSAIASNALTQSDAALLAQNATSAALLTDQASDLAARFTRFKLPQPAWQAAPPRPAPELV